MRRAKFQNIAEVKSRMQIVAPNVVFMKSNSRLGKVSNILSKKSKHNLKSNQAQVIVRDRSHGDRSNLNQSETDLRSISVCFAKTFTFEVARLDRSQFAFKR